MLWFWPIAKDTLKSGVGADRFKHYATLTEEKAILQTLRQSRNMGTNSFTWNLLKQYRKVVFPLCLCAAASAACRMASIVGIHWFLLHLEYGSIFFIMLSF